MSVDALIMPPVWQVFAQGERVGFHAVDRTKFPLYSGVIDGFEGVSSPNNQYLLSLVSEVISYVFFLACWPVLSWFRVKTLFRTQASKARRSAALHRLSAVEMSSNVPLSAAQWAHSSKRPNDLEIAAPDGFRSVSFPLCSGPSALADGPAFLPCSTLVRVRFLPAFLVQKILTNRECFDV
jgi:hypothetical protein